jgi:ribosomal-protein-alanine N-acetyltransferase
MKLENSQVRLRRLVASDLAEQHAFFQHHELRDNYFFRGIAIPPSLEELEESQKNIGKDKTKEMTFAIERTLDSEFVGTCSYKNLDWKNGCVEVGIALGTPHTNQGMGTAALRLLVDFLFDELPINRVFLLVFEHNARGIRSYQKIGFQIEGTMREAAFRGGKFFNVVAMGILRSEWEESRRC